MRITDTTEKITESKTPICQNGSGAAISAKIADLTTTILSVYSIHKEKEMIALVFFAFIGYHWFLEIEALFIRK
jgi:hypothetical protein